MLTQSSYVCAKIASAMLRNLGVIGIKICQFLGTRYDWFTESARAEFAKAHQFKDTQGARASMAWVRIQELDGSIAAVKTLHRGRVKQLAAASRVLRSITALTTSPVPLPSGVSDILSRFDEAFSSQGDTSREAAFATEARRHLERRSIGLHVPEIISIERSSLTMEWCPPDIDQGWTDEQAVEAMRGVFSLIMIAGVVHCDIHAGNIYLSRGRPTLIDFGYVSRLTPSQRSSFGTFMLGIAQGQATSAWGSLFGAGEAVPDDFSSIVRRYTALSNDQFNVREFGVDVMRSIKRSERVVPAHFLQPLLALMGLEATLHAAGVQGIDFQNVAAPYCVEATLRGGLS